MNRFGRPRCAWVSAAAVILVLAPATAGTPTELEQRARQLEGRLMAPCCGATTLAEHESGAATQMRMEIHESLSQGRTEDEILDAYVARYGDQILAMPRASGFGLLAYVLPALLLFLAVGVVLVTVHRWRNTPTPPDKIASLTDLDREYLERLERELNGSLRGTAGRR